MDHGLNSAESDAQALALSNSALAWERYYKQASRRRHAMGTRTSFRDEKRRRRIRERIGLVGSAVLIGGLILLFDLILSR